MSVAFKVVNCPAVAAFTRLFSVGAGHMEMLARCEGRRGEVSWIWPNRPNNVFVSQSGPEVARRSFVGMAGGWPHHAQSPLRLLVGVFPPISTLLTLF